MRCWTFGAALAMLVFGSADALDNCDSNVLVKAYEGLNVNAQLVSCMTQNNFSAALDGSVDLTTVNAATAPEQVKSICAADSCKTILSALVGSANFNLTNCIVGNNIHHCCADPAQTPASTTAAPTTAPAPASTTAAPTPAPAATTAAPTEAPASTTAAPTAAPTEAPATEAPASTTAAPTEAPATEAPATEAPATEAPATEAPATEAPASTTATPTTTTAPSLDDPTQQQQQQQQTTFSVLSSDSGSAAGVTPGKYCK
ncbi:Elicitin [Phytophthora cactorum]|nr:Elicitin [Phytophthora cactorum]